jgi:fucose permease
MLFLTLFFESVCFPTIVALGIRGLGRHYKKGSGLIVGGVCGGAVVPPILAHVADMRNSTGFAMIVPTMVSNAVPYFFFFFFFFFFFCSFLIFSTTVKMDLFFVDHIGI